MAKTCDGCRQPIREGQAHLTEHTLTTSRAWHTSCCPLVPKPVLVPAEPKKDTD
jgi:hypothetical protein